LLAIASKILLTHNLHSLHQTEDELLPPNSNANSNDNNELLRIAETPTLVVSDSITLRPAVLDDTEIFMALVRKNVSLLDPWFSKFEPPDTPEERREIMAADLEPSDRHERYWWMIEYKEMLVGKIDIHAMNRPSRSGSIGYWLDDAFTGNGIVTASTKAIINWGFNELNFNRIDIECALQNTASAGIPERLGLRREAILRQANIVNGDVQDMAIYAALADNWPPAPPAAPLAPKILEVDNEIRLRPIAATDEDAMWNAIDGNRDYMEEFLPWVSGFSTRENHTKGFNQNRLEDDRFDRTAKYAIEYLGELAGTAGFGKATRDNGVEIGYWLRQDLQGNGIVTRAVAALIEMAIVQMGMHRIVIRAATNNLPSQGIPKRLGFTREGTIRGGAFLRNEYFDLEMYSMLDHEWLSRSKNA
jgi:ribosomal-protein-serine acetyltransferase